MTSTIQKIRKDGKPARRPLLGLPPTVLKAPADDFTLPAPNWHDLVQPGPTGDAEKKRARAEAKHRPSAHLDIDPAPRGPVRAGKFTPRKSRKAAPFVESVQFRPMKGRRTAGLVEVRHGGTAVRMAKIRNRPVEATA